MSERKQTPDILAEILGGPAAVEPEPGVALSPHPVAARHPKISKKPAGARAVLSAVKNPAVQVWEHRVASFQEHKGWRLRFVDGVEVPNWAGGMTLCEYIAAESDEGWQVAGACAGQAMFGLLDKYQIYLKRLGTK